MEAAERRTAEGLEEDWRRTGGGLEKEDWRRIGGGLEEAWRRIGRGLEEAWRGGLQGPECASTFMLMRVFKPHACQKKCFFDRLGSPNAIFYSYLLNLMLLGVHFGVTLEHFGGILVPL